MEELWEVRCYDGTEEKWKSDVRLSDQDMRVLLQHLLCRNLDHHEIIESMAGTRGLLVIREENRALHTVDGLLQYTARKKQ